MKSDTSYIRAISENPNLPALMRETLRDAAQEIESLRDAGLRVVSAFESLGKASGVAENFAARQKCEIAMVELKNVVSVKG